MIMSIFGILYKFVHNNYCLVVIGQRSS